MATLWTAIADFFAKIITNLIGRWFDRKEMRARGKLESEKAAHEDNAKRKERADDVLVQPIKKGDELIDSLRNRSNNK